MKESRFIIETFNGNQATADLIAAKHLETRLKQRDDGENEFQTNILGSQDDLKNMQTYYVEPGGGFWIAKEAASKNIAGFVGLCKKTNDIGMLKRMAVMPEYRGHHLGQRLVDALTLWAANQGFQTICLATGKDERARKLVYEPLGFVAVGFDDVHQDHMMELQLSEDCKARSNA
ncbi:MAG: GNAT family N-acetyltransferase [Candidatus Nomurabacteria bacterium]|nr:GNAT family N-acetyltransferase [Candidatus Nomurabacteria bacterium]